MGRREKIFVLLVGCLFSLAWTGGSSWQEWSESTLRRLSPPDEEDYRDLCFLDTLLAGKTFLILGEETHGEEVTTAYKVRLIRYLNRQLGYTVLLTEGLNFHTPATAAAAKENASLAYLGSDLFLPFYEQPPERFRLWGIDTNPDASSRSFIDSLHHAVSQAGTADFPVDWEEMKKMNTFLHDYRNQVPASSASLQIRLRQADELITALRRVGDSLLNGSDSSAFERKWWVQKIDNRICELEDFRLSAQNLFLHKEFTMDSLSRRAISLRDRQMAENIRWIKSMYPDEKFIIWVATVHGMTSYGLLEEPHRSRFGYRRSLRSWLDEWFPGQTYTLAFNDYRGAVDDGKQLQGELPTPSAGSLEAVLNRHYAFSFVDFSTCRDSLLTGQPFKASLVGGEKEGRWMQAVDGVLFIRQQKPLYKQKLGN